MRCKQFLEILGGWAELIGTVDSLAVSKVFTHWAHWVKFLNLGGPEQNFENLWIAVDVSLMFGLSNNVFLVDINLFGYDLILRNFP